MLLRAAAAQIPVTPDVAANRDAILRAVAFAASEKADILLTPEGSLSGYVHTFDSEALTEALRSVTRAAREAGVGLALGTCYVEPTDGRCYNQVRFYDPAGEYQGFHAKVLRCGTLATPSRGEIEVFATAPLRTFTARNVQVGALICNDLWANPMCTPQDDPHLTQRLAELGARIIFHAVNGGRGTPFSPLCWQYHESNLRLRAAAGRLWIVTVDSCFPPDTPCSAPSGVVTPAGEWKLQAPRRGEHFFACDLEIGDPGP